MTRCSSLEKIRAGAPLGLAAGEVVEVAAVGCPETDGESGGEGGGGGDVTRTGDSPRIAGGGVKHERGKCVRCMQLGHFKVDCTAKQYTY